MTTSVISLASEGRKGSINLYDELPSSVYVSIINPSEPSFKVTNSIEVDQVTIASKK